MSMKAKVYVVMAVDRETGSPHGPPLAVKLTHLAAHQVAKRHAPAKVFGPYTATKTDPQAPKEERHGYPSTEP